MAEQWQQKLRSLQRHQRPPEPESPEPVSASAVVVAEAVTYTQKRGRERLDYLILYLADGSQRFFDYASLDMVETTNDKVVCYFLRWKVTLTGRNLAGWAEDLIAHRLPKVQAIDPLQDQSELSEQDAVVHVVEVERHA